MMMMLMMSVEKWEKWMGKNVRRVVRDVKSSKGVALAQQLHYETIKSKKLVALCVFGLVGFGYQYNTICARLTNHLLPWLLLYWLLRATQRKPQIPMKKTIRGRKREGNEKPEALSVFPYFYLLPLHNQLLLFVVELMIRQACPGTWVTHIVSG